MKFDGEYLENLWMMMDFGYSKAKVGMGLMMNIFPFSYVKNKFRKADERAPDNSGHHDKINRSASKSSRKRSISTANSTVKDSPPIPDRTTTQTLASMLGGGIDYYDENMLTADVLIDVSLRFVKTNQSGYESDAWSKSDKKVVRFI